MYNELTLFIAHTLVDTVVFRRLCITDKNVMSWLELGRYLREYVVDP